MQFNDPLSDLAVPRSSYVSAIKPINSIRHSGEDKPRAKKLLKNSKLISKKRTIQEIQKHRNNRSIGKQEESNGTYQLN